MDMLPEKSILNTKENTQLEFSYSMISTKNIKGRVDIIDIYPLTWHHDIGFAICGVQKGNRDADSNFKSTDAMVAPHKLAIFLNSPGAIS